MKHSWWLIALAVLGLSFLSTYNNLQQKEEAVFKAWADVESTLARRADLLPNLVATVKGYAQHERETLEGVVKARAKATRVQLNPDELSNAEAMRQFQNSQVELGAALSRLLAVVESYPDLKANENFLDLQHQLEGTENRINVARERYNDSAAHFNAAMRRFPANLVNQLLLHLERKEYFKAGEQAKETPKVSF